MKNLTNEELLDINGGGIKTGVAAAIFGAGIFIIGVIDGLLRPLKCYKK